MESVIDSPVLAALVYQQVQPFFIEELVGLIRCFGIANGEVALAACSGV
jgi:hypothetical protein